MARYKTRQEKKVTINGKRRSIYYYSDTEFNEKYSKLLIEEEKAKSKKFKDVADEWQEHHDISIQKYTQQCYIAPLKNVKDWFGEQDISTIKPIDIQAEFDNMFRMNYAYQSINLRKIVLNQIFNYAVMAEYITYSPMSAVKIPRNAPKKRTEIPDEEIVKQIFENVNKTLGLFALLACTTGGRRGELLALTKNDIDLENNIIIFNKVLILSDNTKPIVRQGTKSTSGNRSVPILPIVKPILEQELNKIDTEYIFTHKGKPYLKYQYDKDFARYKKESGINVNAHKLRHLYTTLGVDGGVPVKEMQHLLGHAKQSTTQNFYDHYRVIKGQKIDEKISEKLQKIFDEEKNSQDEKEV